MKIFDYAECMYEHGGYADTENRSKVRLLCDDIELYGNTKYPIIGALLSTGTPYSFSEDGICATNPNMNLFTPSKRIKATYWLNIYNNEFHYYYYYTKYEADRHSEPDRLACVEVTIDCCVGDGLEK